jgi:hypothetical protein
MKKIVISFIALMVVFFNTIPVQAVSDFYSENDIQFYDPNACDPNGESSDSDITSTAGHTGGDIYIIGDSITSIAENAYKNKFKDPWRLTIDGLSSRRIRPNTPDPGGIKKIKEDKDKIKEAKSIVVALGTNNIGYSASSIKKDVSDAIKEVRRANSSAPIFWVNTYDHRYISNSRSANKAISEGVGSNGKIIDWYKEAKVKADTESFNEGVHPTKQKDIDLLVNLVYNSVNSGSASVYTGTYSFTSEQQGWIDTDVNWGPMVGGGDASKTSFVALSSEQETKTNPKMEPGDIIVLNLEGKTAYAIWGDSAASRSASSPYPHGFGDGTKYLEVSPHVANTLIGKNDNLPPGVRVTLYPKTAYLLGSSNKDKRNQVNIDRVGAEVSGGQPGEVSNENNSNCVCFDPESGETTTLDGNNNIEMVFNFFVSKGLKDFQAAGVIGNMKHESGVEPQRAEGVYDRKVTAEEFISGVGGPGWGIVQWTPGSKFINPSKSSGKDPNKLEVQLDFLWDQLNNKTSSPEGSAGESLKKTGNVSDATTVFQNEYERPLNKTATISQRIAAAKTVLKTYSGPSIEEGGAVDSSGCSGSPSSSVAGSGGWDLSGQNSMVYYNQCDPKWGNTPYGKGKSSICEGGCGITSLAMIVSTLKNNKTPKQLSDRYGDRYHTFGTDWSLWPVAAKDYNLKMTDLGKDLNKVKGILESGGLVLLSVDPGAFTSAGHFMVIRKIDDDKFYLADPNKGNRAGGGDTNENGYTAEFLINQGALKHLWGWQK